MSFPARLYLTLWIFPAYINVPLLKCLLIVLCFFIPRFVAKVNILTRFLLPTSIATSHVCSQLNFTILKNIIRSIDFSILVMMVHSKLSIELITIPSTLTFGAPPKRCVSDRIDSRPPTENGFVELKKRHRRMVCCIPSNVSLLLT